MSYDAGEEMRSILRTDPLTPEAVQQGVAIIRRERGDDEWAHSLEDELHLLVLLCIATGSCSDAQRCAEEASKTQHIKFARWCA